MTARRIYRKLRQSRITRPAKNNTIVYVRSGDGMIITKENVGFGDVYLVKRLFCNTYFSVYSTFNYNEAVERFNNCNPDLFFKEV